jgi:putative transcriptional regulator
MIKDNIKKGVLLIAEPSVIGDVSFSRSVILLADHNESGSVGFILNKPLDFTVNDLVPDVEASFTVYNGGPVEQDNLYFLHTIPDLISDSIEISDGIYWGGNFEITKNLINSGLIQKDTIRFFLGYSGWTSNQLDEEIESNSWILSQNNFKSAILKTPSTEFWKEKIMELGGEYIIWSNAPENPILN